MRATTATALVLAVLLVGCQGDPEPADPPTSQDALTTTDAAPTTDAPPSDDVSETSAAPDDVAVTTDAGGPPTLPDEARENTEAGAEAFALHYLAVVNFTSRTPTPGLIEKLSAGGCLSCENRANSVRYSADNHEHTERDLFDVNDSVALYDPGRSTAVVRVDVQQIAQDVFSAEGDVVDTIDEQSATLVFDLAWDAGWSVTEIQVDLPSS